MSRDIDLYQAAVGRKKSAMVLHKELWFARRALKLVSRVQFSIRTFCIMYILH